MKILLLGAYGQLGTELSELLPKHGHTVLRFHRFNLDLEQPFTETSLRDVPFDALINCAAYHRVDEIESGDVARDKAYAVNARAVEMLARTCADRKAHFVHVSTDYVFGTLPPCGFNGQLIPHIEEMPATPLNDYGRSKLAGETRALTVYPEGTTVARVASLFGRAGASGKGGNFVRTMQRLRDERKPIRVVADQHMSPTYAADAAGAIAHLVRHRVTGTVHCSNRGIASWFGLAAHALRAHSDPRLDLALCTTSDMPTLARRPAWSVLDVAKLERLGHRMRHWTDAVDAYLRETGE